jgi:peptidoglycan-associated lipoprotein
MKPIKFSKLLVFAFIVSVAATGCQKTPVKLLDMQGSRMPPGPMPGGETAPTNIGPGQPIVPPPEGTGSRVTTPAKPQEPMPQVGPEVFAKYIPHPEILKAYAVYFDFDRSLVKSGERPKVSAVAEYLKGHLAEAVRIEGNCDERGTEEYNRALGERRALALRAGLVELGAEARRIMTVSWGKDKPVALGHDEASWSQNRRGDFIVLTPPAAP